MIRVTFEVYEPVLDKTFINTIEVKTMEDFTLYARSMWSGNWKILSVCEEITRVG